MGATLSLHERFGEELDDIEFPLDEFVTDASIASPRRTRHPSGVKWGSVTEHHDADDNEDRTRTWVSRASVARMYEEAVNPSAPREAFRPRLLLNPGPPGGDGRRPLVSLDFLGLLAAHHIVGNIPY